MKDSLQVGAAGWVEAAWIASMGATGVVWKKGAFEVARG
jgi:hypothetical protein